MIQQSVTDTIYVATTGAQVGEEFVTAYRVIIGVLFALVMYFLKEVASNVNAHGRILGAHAERLSVLEQRNEWEEARAHGFRRKTDPKPESYPNGGPL